LKRRRQAAHDELAKLMEDVKSFPINYNHYNTDTISKSRQDRQKVTLAECLKQGTTTSIDSKSRPLTSVDIGKVVASFSEKIDPNMDNFSCEEALDCLFAIYNVRLNYLHIREKDYDSSQILPFLSLLITAPKFPSLFFIQPKINITY
jgi:hypothetical protein